MAQDLDRWSVADEVTREGLMGYLEELAKGVRLSGSADEARAFDYVEGFFRDLGYEIYRDAPELLVGYPTSSQLEVLEPEHRIIECNGFSMSPSTPDEGIEAELIDVGNGSAAEYAGVEAEGRIVLSTGLATPQKALDVDRARAAGQVHVCGEHIHEMCISPVWGVPTPETLDLLPRTTAVGITGADGEYLRSLLARGPVKVKLTSKTYLDWTPIPVLTAELPGTEEDDFVLFSAHIDSWHYGAMDNASANAVQLAVGRMLAGHRDSLRRGVRFAFWSGHSHGRFAGSTWYADTFFEELRARCVCHVNVDSVGAVGADILTDASTMAETVGLAAELIKEGSGQELDYRRIGRAGDQSFWGVGIPSMFDTFSEQSATDTPTAAAAKALSGGGKRGGGFGWWWHTTEDTLDKVDPDNLLRDARIYAAGLWELCTQPALPIDYAAAAREIHDRLEHYQEVAGDRLDLSSPIAHASDAVSHLERVNELKSSADDVKRLNRSIVKIGHALVPINYTKVGPFDHDLALNVTAVPALAGVAKLAELDPGSTEMRSLQARLVRERNRVSAALMEAVGVAEGAA